jgi:succinate dehydrogenase hydrophobic anchor subunit
LLDLKEIYHVIVCVFTDNLECRVWLSVRTQTTTRVLSLVVCEDTDNNERTFSYFKTITKFKGILLDLKEIYHVIVCVFTDNLECRVWLSVRTQTTTRELFVFVEIKQIHFLVEYHFPLSS